MMSKKIISNNQKNILASNSNEENFSNNVNFSKTENLLDSTNIIFETNKIKTIKFLKNKNENFSFSTSPTCDATNHNDPILYKFLFKSNFERVFNRSSATNNVVLTTEIKPTFTKATIFKNNIADSNIELPFGMKLQKRAQSPCNNESLPPTPLRKSPCLQNCLDCEGVSLYYFFLLKKAYTYP